MGGTLEGIGTGEAERVLETAFVVIVAGVGKTEYRPLCMAAVGIDRLAACRPAVGVAEDDKLKCRYMIVGSGETKSEIGRAKTRKVRA